MKEIIKWLEEIQYDAQVGKENLLEWIQSKKDEIKKQEIKLLKYDYKIESIKEAIEKLKESK